MPTWLQSNIASRPDAPIRLALLSDALVERSETTTVILLHEGSFTLGRKLRAREQGAGVEAPHIEIDAAYVSARHATLRVTSSTITICDEDSRNGTIVNGLRLQKGLYELQDGDCISFHYYTPALHPFRRIWVCRGDTAQDLEFRERGLSSQAREFKTLGIPPYAPRIIAELWFQHVSRSIANPCWVTADAPNIPPEYLHDSLLEDYIATTVRGILPAEARAYRDEEHRQIHLILPSDNADHETLSGSLELALKNSLHKYSKLKMDSTAKESARPRLVMVGGTSTVHLATLYHLSDIHFGSPGHHGQYDRAGVEIHRTRILKALIRDIKNEPSPRGQCWVLISGDLAHGGQESEYEQAYQFLNELVSAMNANLDRVRIVPGNHDVDRSLTRGLLPVAFHRTARSDRAYANWIIGDDYGRAELQNKLKSYQQFIAKIPDHPVSLDWRLEILPETWLLGMCTVWISDKDDTNEPTGNLIVSHQQMADLIPPGNKDFFRILLSHHPLEWLTTESKKEIRNITSERPMLHLCGHIHEREANTNSNFDGSGKLITLNAGTLHRGKEAGSMTYQKVVLEVYSDCVRVGLAPRIYIDVAQEFRPHVTGAESLDNRGFAWRTVGSD